MVDSKAVLRVDLTAVTMDLQKVSSRAVPKVEQMVVMRVD